MKWVPKLKGVAILVALLALMAGIGYYLYKPPRERYADCLLQWTTKANTQTAATLAVRVCGYKHLGESVDSALGPFEKNRFREFGGGRDLLD